MAIYLSRGTNNLASSLAYSLANTDCFSKELIMRSSRPTSISSTVTILAVLSSTFTEESTALSSTFSTFASFACNNALRSFWISLANLRITASCAKICSFNSNSFSTIF